ncbi:MAG: hypothetical protein U9O95_05810 [Candidatus Marinimicrobia bacterium]|nr:hypothetical protein [Candidatus Neomarinimicrobiota bacterium]
MKQLKKIETDNIVYEDKRFDYKANKDLNIIKVPNSLPLFWEKDTKYIPVTSINKSSFKDQQVDALVYSSDSDYEEILLELLKSEDQNIFNISGLISLLENYAPGYNKQYWARELKFGLDQWNSIRNLIDYETSWIDFFLTKNVPLKRILNFSDRELRKTILLLLDLNPGINILESIANLLKEVARKKQTAVKTICEDFHIVDIVTNEKLTSSEKLQTIRKKLYELRYPTIAKYRERMKEHITNIPRTAGIDLHSDENFETPGMRLQADLRSRADIEKLQNWLETQKLHLEKIIDIQKGNDKNEQE